MFYYFGRNLDLVDLGTTALSLLAGTYFSQVWQGSLFVYVF